MKVTSYNSIGQLGEYLVASELCRRGIVATTFTRNMPEFDILALNIYNNKEFKIQVKTIKPTGDWQLNAANFLKFNKDKFEDGVQEIEGTTEDNTSDFFVFVRIGETGYGSDKFYVIPTKNIKEIVRRNYQKFLEKNNGKRPKNPESTHTAVRALDLEDYKEREDYLNNGSKLNQYNTKREIDLNLLGNIELNNLEKQLTESSNLVKENGGLTSAADCACPCPCLIGIIKAGPLAVAFTGVTIID